jgi:hypothetical protein
MLFPSAFVELNVVVNTPLALAVPEDTLSELLVPVAATATAALAIGLPNPSRTVTVIVDAVDPTEQPDEQAVIVPVAATTDDWVGLTSVCATPVAVNVAGVSPAADAWRVLVPAIVPRVQLVTRARPAAFVATEVVGFTEPPPAVTANVTAIPGKGLLY